MHQKSLEIEERALGPSHAQEMGCSNSKAKVWAKAKKWSLKMDYNLLQSKFAAKMVANKKFKPESHGETWIVWKSFLFD